jgi:hypothetical protein
MQYSCEAALKRREREQPTGFCRQGKFCEARFYMDHVAQVGNLPYRRLAVGKRSKLMGPADYQSAARQTASLRYDFSLDRAGGPDTLAAMRTGRTHSHLAA